MVAGVGVVDVVMALVAMKAAHFVAGRVFYITSGRAVFLRLEIEGSRWGISALL